MSGAHLDGPGFNRVAQIAERDAGLSIPEAKRSMVQSRLNRRLRATGSPDFHAYLDYVESTGGREERHHMISALTTNVSHFFREDHHFADLRENILPDLQRLADQGQRIRIWSAGCSTGQEPYSIAMTVLDAAPRLASADFRILATDIDRRVLSQAVEGLFDDRQLEPLPANLRDRFLTHAGTSHVVSADVSGLITFKQLNLIEPWPMSGQFNVIFCRNVLIYFSETTQRTLWPRFSEVMRPGGTLYLGHSERMHENETFGFRSVGVTTYRKCHPEKP